VEEKKGGSRVVGPTHKGGGTKETRKNSIGNANPKDRRKRHLGVKAGIAIVRKQKDILGPRRAGGISHRASGGRKNSPEAVVR